ncbi:magnesium transporter [Aeromonas piscicola]|uniref:Magnesium transporter MgtE n=1 Tax=Aeromonas piscicola TaxID=600645 RepID=A0ABT7QD88_9GAMM|nr:magnesium transporter [Aeromonas piscicola]MDM5131907.1 magnesium transporter [Aeromonas piscicola]
MQYQDIHQQLYVLLQNKDRMGIQSLSLNIHEVDLAQAIKRLTDKHIHTFLSLVPALRAARIFRHLPSDIQASLVRSMAKTQLEELCTRLSPDDRADLYNRLPAALRQILLDAMTEEEREDTQRLASYSDSLVGSIMSSDCASLPADITVGEGLQRLRSTAADRESIYTLYVVDEMRRLIGVVSLRELFLADSKAPISSIMQRELVSIQADAHKGAAADMIARYNLLALPVLNNDRQLLGMVTVDDAMDVAEEEDANRIARFGGTAALGGPELDLRASSTLSMFNARFFWLAVLTIFGILTSNLVAAQEDLLSEVLILAAFIAPIIDMGGNAGSQSATLVIRSMGMGQLKLSMHDFFFVLRRDLPVAVALGVGVAVLEGVMAFWSKSIGWDIVLIVSLSAMTVTVVGSLLGLALPFVARKIGTDPATLSSPMLTSIMDLLGVLIYFGFAYAFLGSTLVGA